MSTVADTAGMHPHIALTRLLLLRDALIPLLCTIFIYLLTFTKTNRHTPYWKKSCGQKKNENTVSVTHVQVTVSRQTYCSSYDVSTYRGQAFKDFTHCVSEYPAAV